MDAKMVADFTLHLDNLLRPSRWKALSNHTAAAATASATASAPIVSERHPTPGRW